MHPFLSRVLAVLSLILFLGLFVVGIVLVSSLLLAAAAVGFILLGIAWIKAKFFSSDVQIVTKIEEKKGRTFDQDEFK